MPLRHFDIAIMPFSLSAFAITPLMPLSLFSIDASMPLPCHFHFHY
jgi:hypothetical protein